jgi:hypothetical protein
MTAGAKRATKPPSGELSFDQAFEARRPTPFTVQVRTALGDEMEGLEAHGDGISFRSPRPFHGNEAIELVICRAVLVDACVVGCTLMPGEENSYWVRARFQDTTPAMNELICGEVNRLIALEDQA